MVESDLGGDKFKKKVVGTVGGLHSFYIGREMHVLFQLSMCLHVQSINRFSILNLYTYTFSIVKNSLN